MLLLQLKSLLPKLPRKNIFFIKLLAFSLLLHIVFFCFITFFQYRSYKRTALNVTTMPNEVTVIVLPLIKTVPNALQQQQQPCKPSNPIIHQQSSVKPKPVPKKINVSPQKKLTPKKVQPVKKVAPPLKKKNAVWPVSKKKPSIEKKQPIKKTEKKNEESKINNEIPEKNMQLKAQPASKIQEVGHQDLDLIALCNEIKEGIAQCWKRPANIASATQCLVKVCVHSETLREVIIVKSSQALALDIMVKNFLLHYPFPKAIWHKEIELVF